MSLGQIFFHTPFTTSLSQLHSSLDGVLGIFIRVAHTVVGKNATLSFLKIDCGRIGPWHRRARGNRENPGRL